jgi:acyl-ACP thioesterase
MHALVPPPPSGRVWTERRRPGPAAATPLGRVKLDALVNWLQDVAYADVLDAGVAEAAVWLVRWTRLRGRLPAFGADLELRTWCSGVGRAWAERRTDVVEGGQVCVEAASLWVLLHRETLRPLEPAGWFGDVYAEAAAGRTVRARLRHPAPPEGAARSSWLFRASDLDIAGHVNNAAYWALLEERIAELEPGGTVDVELEHRAPADAGHARVLSADGRLWVCGPDDAVLASFATG